MKELKIKSNTFRTRSQVVELARIALYFIFLYFGTDVMLDHLPKFWVVVMIVLGITIIDWTLRRLWLLPAAELEIKKQAEQAAPSNR